MKAKLYFLIITLILIFCLSEIIFAKSFNKTGKGNTTKSISAKKVCKDKNDKSKNFKKNIPKKSAEPDISKELASLKKLILALKKKITRLENRIDNLERKIKTIERKRKYQLGMTEYEGNYNRHKTQKYRRKKYGISIGKKVPIIKPKASVSSKSAIITYEYTYK